MFHMILCTGPTSNIPGENSLVNIYSIYLVKLGISRSKKISRYTFQNHLTAAFFLQTLIARFGSNLIGVCIFQAHVFSLFFFFFFFSQLQLLTKSSMNSASVHCLQTHKLHFLTTFSLKMGPIALFTHLKIISLQCFQFSVSAK